MKHLYAVFLLLCLLAACTESEHPGMDGENEDPSKAWPGFTSLEISEVLESDAQTVTVAHTYQYDGAGRLTGCVTRQATEGTGAIALERTATVSYGQDGAEVTDDAGNTLAYTFDADGRATACVYRTLWGEVRRYEFDYCTVPSGRHCLARVSETLGDETAPYSEISLDYGTPGEVGVTRMVDGDSQRFVLSFPSDGGVANTAQLPCLFLTELYPLSLHEAALYARWLGDASDVLLSRCEPADNAESGEYTTYAYDVDAGGLPLQCRIQTESYGYLYSRTLTFAFGE